MDYLRKLKLKEISEKFMEKRKMAAQGDHFNINKAIKLNNLDSREKTSGMTLIRYSLIYYSP